MEPAHVKVLRENQVTLKDSLKSAIVDVLEYLETNGIITDAVKERVQYKSRVPGEQASELLLEMRTKGMNAFQLLIAACLASNLFEAADILEPEAAPHEPPYTAPSRPEIFSSSVGQNDELSEDEDLPDHWPLNRLEKEEEKVRVKNWRASPKPENLQRYYDYACSLKGEKCIYSLVHKIRGLCLIISNEIFEHLENRDGTVKDLNDLNFLFNGLGFEVLKFRNQTSDQMNDLLRKKVLKVDHKDSDCFVLVILSHGANGVVFGTDGQYEANTDEPLNCVNVERIRKLICGVSSLRDKPKLFFLQACRGKENDEGQKYDGSVSQMRTKSDMPGQEEDKESRASQSCDQTNSQPGQCQASGVTNNPTEETQYSSDTDMDLSITKKSAHKPKKAEDDVDAGGEKIPYLVDTFLAQATTPGYVSYRNTKQGTWFIQAVVYVFSRFAYKYDLIELMTKVTQLVSKGEVEITGNKQTVEYTQTFRKLFYFFPTLSKED
ncbi:hypothetical protein RRG08_053384 [Elysia crispata]|uniref:Uncharacterized protein n=1 Tax=Elysia crispata TaxID=231223 RepID=A0AAE1DGQ0_9GAST|nr:hypothetical protein RRG08_053384 [Elysia crispata]